MVRRSIAILLACVVFGACGAPSGSPAPAATGGNALFAYDTGASLDLRVDVAESISGGTIAPISFASPKAGRATGFLALPSGAAPFPAVVLVPGSNAPPSAMRATALELVRRGMAAVAIDQSQTRSGHRPLFTFTPADRDEAVATVIDIRRALDVLAARPDIDATRLGYWGFSHGAFLGGILAGVEKRVRACVLQSGAGADYMIQNAPRQIVDAAALAAYRDAIVSVDPDAFIAHASPASLLLQNGTQDRTYTDAGVAAWVAAASEPKQVKTYPADHLLNAEATADALSFLAGALSRDAARASASGSRSALEDARGVIAEQRVSRPGGSYYVSLVAIEGTPTAVADPAREPGFELAVSGTERLTVDGRVTDLASGHALAIPAGAARQRQSDRAATAYFMSLRPAAQRERSLPPGRSILYESSDLPASATPEGGFGEVLAVLVLAPGQVVPPHLHGGIEPTYVIEGTVELRARGQPVRRLSAGDGDTVLPDTPLLITNVGNTVARVLVMLATPDGKAVQTQTDTP